MDDYQVLGYTLSHFKWSAIRPVTYVVMSCLSACGSKAYFIAMSLMTIAYIALVFSFLVEFLEVKRPRLILVLFAAVCTISWEYFCWYYQYTGIVANMLSGLFGVGAMYSFLRSFNQANWHKGAFIAGVFLTLLSLSSKEDFFLPIFLLCLYFAGAKNQSVKGRARLALCLVLFLGVCIFVEQRLVLNSVFLSGQAFPYRIVTSWHSILKTAWNYLGSTPGSLITLAVQIASFGLGLFFRTSSWSRLVFLQILIISLVAPFTLLPNHIYQYYSLNWIAWQCGSCLVLENVLEGHGGAMPLQIRQWFLPSILLLLLPAVVWLTNEQRSFFIERYAQWSGINKRTLRTLKTNRDLLAKYQAVAVIGAPVISAWAGNDGSFLERFYDLHCRWVVFITSSATQRMAILRYMIKQS